jgi:adenine/guanine phosphoribosyltransferase-like PRPP-binding protein
MEEWGISSDGWMELPVHSYVHNRKRDGTRGIQPVYILDQHLFEGAFVVLVDDAMAEGRSILDTAEGMLGLGASGVGVAVPMAKRMQGGWEALKMHPAIDWQVTMVLVEATHGKDGGMDICNDYNELVCKNPY